MRSFHACWSGHALARPLAGRGLRPVAEASAAREHNQGKHHHQGRWRGRPTTHHSLPARGVGMIIRVASVYALPLSPGRSEHSEQLREPSSLDTQGAIGDTTTIDCW